MEDLYIDIWQLHKIPRGYIDSEDYILILLLIYLYKEDELNHFKYIESSNKKNEFLNLIKKQEKYDFMAILIEEILEKISLENFDALLFNLFDIDKSRLKKNFTVLFEKLLFTYIRNLPKNIYGYLQPDEITRLMIGFLNIPDYGKIYNPFSGLASFAIYLKSTQFFYGQEIIHKTWIIGKLRLLVHKKKNINFNKEDSVWYWPQNIKFDAIISNPPLEQSIDKELSEFKYNSLQITVDQVLITEGIKSLKEGGQLVTILPTSFFINENYYSLRKKLVNDGLIQSVISLPSGLLFNTGISLSILILQKKTNKHTQVHFFDGSNYKKKLYNSRNYTLDYEKLLNDYRSESKMFKAVFETEIIQNDYLLNVNRYVYDEPDFAGNDNIYSLNTLLTLIKNKKETIREGKFVRTKDLKDDIFNSKIDIKSLKKVNNNIRFNYIEKNAVIFNTNSKIFSPNYIELTNERIYLSKELEAFEIDENLILPEYLIYEFSKEYVKSQLYRYRIGAFISKISIENLLKIKIITPSLVDQRLEINNHYLKAKKRSEFMLNENSMNYRIEVADENSFLRHQIATPLKNIRLNFKNLLSIIENKVEPNFKDLYNLKYSDNLSSNLEDYLNRIKRDLDSIKRSIDNTKNDFDISDFSVKEINIIKFLENYVDELKSNNKNHFETILNVDQIKLKEEKQEMIYINGDADYIRKMLDNIVDNADKHGFKRQINQANKILFSLLFDFAENEIQLDISNTGDPLPSEYTYEAFTRKGDSAGEFAGDGTGGWIIDRIIKLHGGKINFINESNLTDVESEFRTTFSLTFPIQII
jgi:type I restriction enzyme M protein